MKIFSTLTVAASLCFAPVISHATIITHGYLKTDTTSNYITDINTGRQYLRFDTFNLSYNATLAGTTDASSVLYGYSIADSVASDIFLDSLLAGNSQCTGNVGYGRACGIANSPLFSDGDFGISYTNSTDGYLYRSSYASSFNGFTSKVGSVGLALLAPSGIYDYDNWSNLGDASVYSTVHPLNYLVYKDAATVPEPSVLALIGLGIFGLGLSRRKLKK